MTGLAYDLHGRAVRIEGATPELEAAIGERLGWAPAPVADDIRIDYVPFPAAGSTGGRTVYESALGTARYDELTDVLTVAGEGISLSCRCAEARAEIAVDPALDRALWLASRPLLTLALSELLKRGGAYPVHAGAVTTDDGRAIVVAGASGSGKSTLSIALARAGLGFMSDDIVFLRRDGALRVLGFPEWADVSRTSAGFFPELDAATWPADGTKLPLDVAAAFGARIELAAAPGAIVFPRVAGGSSVLRPLAAGSALVRLSPDVLLTATGPAQLHLDAIADLVEASECYELALGDLGQAVELVRGLAT